MPELLHNALENDLDLQCLGLKVRYVKSHRCEHVLMLSEAFSVYKDLAKIVKPLKDQLTAYAAVRVERCCGAVDPPAVLRPFREKAIAFKIGVLNDPRAVQIEVDAARYSCIDLVGKFMVYCPIAPWDVRVIPTKAPRAVQTLFHVIPPFVVGGVMV